MDIFGAHKWTILAIFVGALLVATNTWSYRHGIKIERADWVNKQLEASEAADKERAGYEELARGLVKRYLEQESKANGYYRKWRNSVANATTGRVCFSADAVSLYNSSLFGKDDLPAAAGGTSEAPTGTGGATDREVLTTNIDNNQLYKQCRDQLNAIIDFHRGVTKKPK